MKNLKIIIIAAFVAMGFVASAQEDPMARIQPIVDKALMNCDGPIWGDTEEDSVKAINNYSMSLEYFKQVKGVKETETLLKGYQNALVGWRYLFFNTPKARKSTYVNGVTMYKALYKATEDEVLKGAYLDTMLAIYEVREQCMGGDADLAMRKSFEWFNYRRDNEVFVFDMFNKTINMFDKEEDKSVYDISPAFLYPWAAITVTGNKKKLISEDDVFDIYERITDIVDHNVEADVKKGEYYASGEKVTSFMDKYGYLDCSNVIPSAEAQYNEAPNDPENIVKVYKKLKSTKCYDAPFFMEVVEKLVKDKPSAGLYKYLASKYRKEGNQTKAIEYTKLAMTMTEGSSDKASLLLQIARDYQTKGDFSSARNHATQAAEMRGGWGAPYLLIGRLYASSGPKCGSGTGWESQVVVWPAIDVWQKAKSIDPSVADEAQKLINKYSQYMPTKQDGFLRNVAEGSSYTVPCWINRTTTVRYSK